MDIIDLHRQGLNISQIAARTGHDRKTVRTRLECPNNPPIKRKAMPKGSALEPFKSHITDRFEAYGLSATRLFEEVGQMGYTGSLRTVRRFVTSLRSARKASAKLTVRFETPPGKQMQVDWFEPGAIQWHDGTQQTVYGFEAILGASRFSFIVYTTDMTTSTLLQCLEQAFEYFEGVSHEILFDNMKTVRIAPGKINPTMLDFAAHHGFKVTTHRPRRCRTKGKIERLGGYAQDNFLKGRVFDSFDDLNAHNRIWLDKANGRIHGTTRRRPIDDWQATEKSALLPIQPHWCGIPVRRKVSAESMVSYSGNRYSVPPSFCQKQVHVESDTGTIRIRHGDLIIAEHPLAEGKGQDICKRAHLEERWRLSVPSDCPVPTTWHDLCPSVDSVDLQCYEEVFQ